jgi:hypothetical protein
MWNETFLNRLTTNTGPLYVTFMLTADRKVGLQFREDY